MEKIGISKIRRYGKRGFEITLPRIWVTDNGLKIENIVNIYREDGEKLIIMPDKDKSHSL